MTDNKDPSECADEVQQETVRVPFEQLPWSWAVQDEEGKPSAYAERMMLWMHALATTDIPREKLFEFVEDSREFFQNGLPKPKIKVVK
jgi:hypothetical protein